jgi:hypothetical protein
VPEFLASLAAIFAFGTLAFWLAMVVLVGIISFFSEEDGVKATITLVLGALFLQFVAKFDILGFIRHEPFTLAFYGLLYVALGFGFACVKWWRYAKKQRRAYDKLRATFFRKNKIEGNELPPELKESFFAYLKESYKPNQRGDFRHYSDASDADPVIPDITQNKAAFIRWMTYWPLNLLFTLLNDPVRRLFEWLYEVAGVKMQAISNHVFRGTESDRLTKAEQAELERKKSQTEAEQEAERQRRFDSGDFPSGGGGVRRRS